MAIIDGKRWLGWAFFKVRGKREWAAYDRNNREIHGLCADIEEGADPMTARFHYCSPISQLVFIDGSYCRVVDHDAYVQSSWKKMPAEWRRIFRRDLFSSPCPDDPEHAP